MFSRWRKTAELQKNLLFFPIRNLLSIQGVNQYISFWEQVWGYRGEWGPNYWVNRHLSLRTSSDQVPGLGTRKNNKRHHRLSRDSFPFPCPVSALFHGIVSPFSLVSLVCFVKKQGTLLLPQLASVYQRSAFVSKCERECPHRKTQGSQRWNVNSKMYANLMIFMVRQQWLTRHFTIPRVETVDNMTDHFFL